MMPGQTFGLLPELGYARSRASYTLRSMNIDRFSKLPSKEGCCGRRTSVQPCVALPLGRQARGGEANLLKRRM
jgi:hypothetical protein